MQKINLDQSNSIVYLCLGYYLLMAVVAPGFFTVNNSWNLLFNLLPLLIVSIGQTYVMLTGGIDLSVTSIIAMTSITGGYIMSRDTSFLTNPSSIFLAISVMAVVGMTIGLINGLAVTKLGMPAFMVTLTTMILFSGFAIWFTESQNVHNLPESFISMPHSSLIGIPIPVFFGLGVLVLAYFLLADAITPQEALSILKEKGERGQSQCFCFGYRQF